MKKVGFAHVQPGIESLCPSILKAFRKGVCAHRNIALLREGRSRRLDVTWNCLFRIPGDDLEEYAALGRARLRRAKPARSRSLATRSCASRDVARQSRRASWDMVGDAGRVSPAGLLGQNGEKMSRSRSNNGQPAGQGSGRTSRPRTDAPSIRTVSLLLLVGVVFVVAVLMVISAVGFVLDPDPAVKAGPMYVTLTLTTGAALLMLFVALNMSFLPFMSRQRARDVQLVMWAMGVTGIVTGVLTLGGEVSFVVTRLILGSVAFMFITLQNARLTRARAAAPGGQADPPASQAQPRARSRQRRAGRKR